MIIKSLKYPGLLVVGIVKFEDGEAEVTDPSLIERLRRFSVMGVVVPEGDGDQPEGPDEPEVESGDAELESDDSDEDPKPEEPRGNASLAEWRAYAIQQGRDAEDLEGLKRDEVKALLEDNGDI